MRLQSKGIDCKRMEACDERTPLTDFLNSLLAARHGPHDQERLGSHCNRIGQRGIRRFVR